MTEQLAWEAFVWVNGLRGPTPQVWGRDYTPLNLQKQPRDDVLQKHMLTAADQDMSLDALARKYPLEKRHEV